MQEIELTQSFSSYINFENNLDKEINLMGMVQNIRVTGWGGFLILRTPQYNIQCVLDRSLLTIEPETIPVEATVKIKGTIKTASIKDKTIIPNNFEIQVSSLELISSPSMNPLPIDTTKKELSISMHTAFDKRPLALRHPKQRAIFRISSVIFNEFGNFLTTHGFTRICSPKIVKTGAEGGANIFKLDYFGQPAFLAQSPQFYKQMMVGIFGRVFEEAPVFRAEKHDTSRHLNEYISLDFEMALENSFLDLIQVEANLLRHIFSTLEEHCKSELEILGVTLPQLDTIIIMKFKEVHEIIFNEYKKIIAKKLILRLKKKAICEYVKNTMEVILCLLLIIRLQNDRFIRCQILRSLKQLFLLIFYFVAWKSQLVGRDFIPLRRIIKK